MDAEVVIVGAGAAGGVLAAELARRGVRVVVLESGPRHDFARRPEYVRRYLRHQNPWETSPRDLDRQTVGGTIPYRLDGAPGTRCGRQHAPLGGLRAPAPRQ